MPVAYSQTRSIARARVARFDIDAQVSELFTVDDSLDFADMAYPDRVDDIADAWYQADSENIDREYFAKHGHWPDWGFIRWLEKQEEREACAEWYAQNPCQ